MLSAHPQTVLCRAEAQCDLMISLRSLSKKGAENIIVVVEADPEFWIVLDKFKILRTKESGIGQITFAIIPKQVGFLTYPSIRLHSYLQDYVVSFFYYDLYPFK